MRTAIFLAYFLVVGCVAESFNAFFALMVTNPTVIQQVNQIEANLTSTNPQFVKFVHNTSYLHVRLNTIELDEASLPEAKQFLKDLPKNICNISYSIPVLFAGTELSGNKTLYGKMNAMSSTVIASVRQKIYELLNASNITSIDEHEIFKAKMNIVQLDDRKHDDLLQIMNNRTADFRLSTGDFVKEIVLFNSKPSSIFHEEIGRAQLAPCSNFTLFQKTYLLSNRIDDFL